jgi:hypothetical protein
MLAAVALSSAAVGDASDPTALSSAGESMALGRNGGSDESIARGLKEPTLP